MQAQNSDIDAILHFGDLAYGVSHGYIWDQWGWLMSASARYVPYMIGVGNHGKDGVAMVILPCGYVCFDTLLYISVA